MRLPDNFKEGDPLTIRFGEWTPDLNPINSPGVSEAKNVLPSADGYMPFRSVAQITDAINARARGAISAKDKSGVVYGYVGNETKLYSFGATSHTDVTNTGGAYALSSDSCWNFVKWGEKIIGVAIDENPQIITFGDANFADLSGSPPKAAFIAVISDFVVLANINDGTAKPLDVRWSAINDETDWTASQETQSDSQELRSNEKNGGGHIMGIVGGTEYGIVFQEYTIQRMDYVGAPLIFDINEIFPGIGTPCKNSITQEGKLIHFFGQDGFYQISDGTSIKKIGDQKVDKWFLSDLDADYPERVIAASDPKSSNVVWIYPGESSTAGTPNKYIAYNWYLDRWTHGDIDLEWIFSSVSAGYTLEELDNISSSIDTLGISLDDNSLKGGTLRFSVYDTDNKLGSLTNTPLNGTIDTEELNIYGELDFVKKARPLVDGTATIQIGNRMLLTDDVSYTDALSTDSTTGWTYPRIKTRYERFRVNTSGEYNKAIGVDGLITKAGSR